jgi:non-heme Fe2+,alpha-ketoglutarate-dependent halogenase
MERAVSGMELVMESKTILESIKRNGFVNAGQIILTADERKQLSLTSKKIFDSMLADDPDLLKAEAGASGIRGIVERDSDLAKITNKIVSDPVIKEVLTEILGNEYKIWQINFRRSDPKDPGLQLHQDAKGQLNLSILLDDNFNGDGATSFFPSTHLFKERTKELQVELDAKLFGLVNFLLKPFKGKCGDIGFFLNRTWHGRYPNKTDKVHDMFTIGFFPGGTQLYLKEPYKFWSKEFLVSIQGTELHRLIDPDLGTEKVEDGVFKIKSTATKNPYSMQIENFKDNTHLKNPLLKFKVSLLVLAMTFGRPFKKIARKLKNGIA